MNRADELRSRMSLPIIAAPMFIVSGVDLVTACCREGIVGTFPSINGRTEADFEEMLKRITANLAEHDAARPERPSAPFGVNLIVHSSNARVAPDLELCVKYKVPLVITSLGKPTPVIEAVHSYGGIVISDVIHLEYARKAADTGVDGLVLVCSGAGGHAGKLNPLVFVSAVREFFDGIVAMAGCISNGAAVAACEVLGADFAYVGTRLLTTNECGSSPEYKQMIVDSSVDDVIYTACVSGVNGNFLRGSLEQCGFDVSSTEVTRNVGAIAGNKAWKDMWSAGQGVQIIHETESVAELAERLRTEYRAARGRVAERE